MRACSQQAVRGSRRTGRGPAPRLRTAGLIALTLAAAVTAGAPAAGAVGGSALDFEATTTGGERVEGKELAGRWVLLDFWGTWCVPCIAAFPKLQRLQDEHPEELTVVGLAFLSGPGDAVAAFAAEHDVRYTIWMGDEALIEKFGVIAFPSYFVVDPDGEIVLEIVGESADLYEEVSALLPAAASPPTP